MNRNDFPGMVKGRNLNFPAVDGLSQLEHSSILGQIEEKIKTIEEKSKIADTSKLAILAAYDFAVELYNLKQKSETNLTADTKKIDEMVEKLQKTLDYEAEDGK